MIQRFYVHNFRCLENFELPISKRPSTLLVGRNGSGKSTVGLALEVLQKIARGTNRVGDLVRPADFSRGRSDVPLRFEIELVLDEKRSYEYSLALDLPSGFRELRVVEERLSVGGKHIYAREIAQVTFFKTHVDEEAKFLIDWHLVALPLIQVRSETDHLHVFKSWLARMLILAQIPSLIEGDSKDVTLLPNRDVTNFGDWLSRLLADSPAAYGEIDRFLKKVMPDFEDFKNPIVGRDLRGLSVQFEHGQATLSVPFRDLSDGEKCFFICAVVLASNRAYGPSLCFWDEPDNHLALSEVGHFVMDLRRSFESRGQLLVTSHNQEGISRFSGENTFLLHRHNHLEPTLVRPVSEIRINGDFVDALIRNDV